MGLALPGDLKEFVSVHDGGGGLWLHELGVPLSLSGSIEVWDREVGLWGDGNNDEWASPEGPIRKKWFSLGWVPFLDTWCGDCYCIDLDPPEEDRRGQMISWYHDNGPTAVVAPSFAALVRTWAEEVEGGLYVPRVNRQGQPYLERQ
jgi:cell wall assembly regulator SMI1